MSLSKKLAIFIVILALPCHLFSQPETAREVFISAESLLDKNPEQAFSLLQTAMELAQQNKDWETYLKSLNKLAAITYRGDEKKQDQVFAWLKSATRTLGNSKKSDELAQLHFHAAKFYSDLTPEAELAIRNFEKAKEIWIALHGEHNKLVADCYHGLGDIYKYTTFDFFSAEKCYEMALFIREKINFTDLPVLYRNYYSLAATNGSQRDFEKALSYGNKAIETVKKLEPYRQEQCAAMIANIYRDMGNSTLAKKYYFDALRLNEMTNDLDNRAWYYLCLGETFKYDSIPDEALSYFKKAYKLYRTPGVEDQSLFLNLLINVLDIYAINRETGLLKNKHGQSSAVDENELNFRKTLSEIFEELNAAGMLKSTETANVWLIVGKHHAANLRYDSALSCYQKALVASVSSFESNNVLENPTEEMIGLQYYVNEILTRKASALKRVFEKNGRKEFLRRSFECLALAEKLLSKQRNTLDMEGSKWMFLEENFDLYEDIIQNLYEAKAILSQDSINLLAFQYFERSKARSLADALAQNERNRQISNEDSLFRLQSDLKRKLFSAQQQIMELEKSTNQSNLSALRNQVVELDQHLQAVKIAIEGKYPGYFNVMYGLPTASLAEVGAIVKKRQQVLVEYFWGTNSVYALCLADNKILFSRIGTPDSIRNLINGVLLQLGKQQSSTNHTRYQYYSNGAYQLYAILMGPFKELLKDKNRIQIIPDGSINQIPFEILLEEKPTGDAINYRSLKYMIKSFAIGYAYSSSMLTRGSVRRAISPAMLAMGYKNGQSLSEAGKILGAIQGTEKELQSLAKRFNSGTFLFGEEANEANFKAFAPQSDIIHLAVHGSGDIEKNFAASLYFGAKHKQEDGELHAYELYGLKLKALLAVLSSCESGLGKGYRGEGMISMASAFTYSGCQNILMSLWKVGDQASIGLMDNFYVHLLNGETIDAALRQTKLNYLEAADEISADPKMWAPLVAYGNLDGIFLKERSNIVLFVSAATVLAMLLLIFIKVKKHKT